MKAFFITATLLLSTSFSPVVFADDAENLGSTKSAEISFEKGLATVSDSEREELRKSIEDAKALGPITEIKVISWADREYPAEGEKASKDSVKLAEARSNAVKRYLADMNVRRVKSYNMASRPNSIQELFNTSQAKVKDKLEKSGAAPTSKEDTGFLGMNGKTSSAVVLIYTRGNPTKL